MSLSQVLIADDSPMIVKIIKKALLENTTDLHFEDSSIFTASDGMEAFEVMAKNPDIRLIITDINMPYLNGDEFVEILQDTNKIENVDVIFVTSTKIILKPEIKHQILGIIYKPFNTVSFNKKLQQLYLENRERTKQKKELQKQQIILKKIFQQISIAYLERCTIECNKKILDEQINDNIPDEVIQESEYIDVIYAALSLYMFDIQNNHTVNVKLIRCIMNAQNKSIRHEENSFRLISGFKDTIKSIDNEKLSNKELLYELTNPIAEKLSFILASVKGFPQESTRRFLIHFDYMVEEFNKIDCEFTDEKLRKLLLALKETTEFKAWLENFLENNEICTIIPVIKQNSPMHNAITKRLKNTSIKNNIVMQHYCGEVNSYIWKRAKESKEIVNHLQTKMSKRVPNSLEFLYARGKYTSDEYKKDYKLDKQNVIVISNSLDTLEIFKSLILFPFDNWDFYAFARANMLEAWLESNEPHRIVVDYNFKTQTVANGIEFITTMLKIYPILENIIKRNQLFLIVNNFDVVKIQKSDTIFTIIDSKLNVNDITKTLLYH